MRNKTNAERYGGKSPCNPEVAIHASLKAHKVVSNPKQNTVM
jgi:hypothetical protein